RRVGVNVSLPIPNLRATRIEGVSKKLDLVDVDTTGSFVGHCWNCIRIYRMPLRTGSGKPSGLVLPRYMDSSPRLARWLVPIPQDTSRSGDLLAGVHTKYLWGSNLKRRLNPHSRAIQKTLA